MDQHQLDIVVVGNAGIDTNVYFYTNKINFDVEANFTENIDYIGQAGGYASHGYTRLGKKTAFVGYVGEDFSGRFIQETFFKDGIDITGVFIDPSGTSRSINFMYPDGRRKNFYDGKGHMHLRPNLEICKSVLSRARLAHFNIPNWGRHLLPIAKEAGLIIACDIQDVVDVHDPYRQDFIQAADYLFFSAINHEDPTPLMHAFWKVNPGVTMVTGMGAKGCAVGIQADIKFYPPVSLEIPVIDTNGAGDALAVGFLSSHIFEGYSLEDAILRGQIAARFTCTQKADSSNLITHTQLDELFHQNKMKS